PGSTEANWRLALEAFGLEEPIHRLFAAGQVRIADEIRPRVVGSAGEDVAIVLHRERKTGLQGVDSINYPAAGQFFQRARSFVKRQLVDEGVAEGVAMI